MKVYVLENMATQEICEQSEGNLFKTKALLKIFNEELCSRIQLKQFISYCENSKQIAYIKLSLKEVHQCK